MAGGLNLADDRQDIGRKPRRIRHTGGAHALRRARGVRCAAPLPMLGPALMRSEMASPLVLGYSGQDVDRQLVRVRVIDRDELAPPNPSAWR